MLNGVVSVFCLRALAMVAVSGFSQDTFDTSLLLQVRGCPETGSRDELMHTDAMPSGHETKPSGAGASLEDRPLRFEQFSPGAAETPSGSANFGNARVDGCSGTANTDHLFMNDAAPSGLDATSSGGFAPIEDMQLRSAESRHTRAWDAEQQLRQLGTRVSHEYCQNALRNKNHVFHGMWSHQGIIALGRFTLSTGPHTQKCWEGMRMSLAEYLVAVRNQRVLGHTCVRNWRAPQPIRTFDETTSMILGNDMDIFAACGGNGDCQRFNMHMLFLLHPWGSMHWNMCRNFEFVSCGAMGGLQGQDGGLVYLATAPKDLQVINSTAEAQMAWYRQEMEYHDTTVITVFEVCLLDQLCANYEELFTLDKGQFFRCQFDERRFFQLETLL